MEQIILGRMLLPLGLAGLLDLGEVQTQQWTKSLTR